MPAKIRASSLPNADPYVSVGLYAARSAPATSAELPSLAEVEQEDVNRVLAEHEGNVSQAAKVLGVHRRSLQRRLRKDS